jgi:carbon monoxide dehydrogenase subunit G
VPEASDEIVIHRPVSEVWSFLADPENDPQWRDGVLEIKRLAGDGAGRRYRQRVRGPGGRPIAADIELTELVRDSLIGFRGTAGPVRPRGRYELEPVTEGTRLRFSLDAELRGAKRLMAPMVRRTMAAEVGRLPQLKRVLEGNVA